MFNRNSEIEELKASLHGMEALIGGLIFGLIQRRIFSHDQIVREIKHTEAQLLMMSAPAGTVSVLQRMREALEDDANPEAA
ncbi:hypothetical protein [Microvirga antarctica]|uniref:hypothetical protein n=1 Tax=Microvirga antarctica TaxID=2819233 RepID=UPI001B3100BB|nr:hypothetical protein [Microvirga antarctica]